MKKGTKFVLGFPTVLLFTQVCFANYASYPRVQNSITRYDKKQMNNDQTENAKNKKTVRIIILVILITLAIAGLISAVGIALWLNDVFPA